MEFKIQKGLRQCCVLSWYIFSSRYRLRFSCSVSWRTWKASMNDICFAQTSRLRSVLLSPSPGGEDHLNGLNLKKETSRVRLKINFNKTFNYSVSIFEPGLALPIPNLAIRYCFCLSSRSSSYISEINFTGFRHARPYTNIRKLELLMIDQSLERVSC